MSAKKSGKVLGAVALGLEETKEVGRGGKDVWETARLGVGSGVLAADEGLDLGTAGAQEDCGI